MADNVDQLIDSESESQTCFERVCVTVLLEINFLFWWQQLPPGDREQLLFVPINAPLEKVTLFCVAMWFQESMMAAPQFVSLILKYAYFCIIINMNK